MFIKTCRIVLKPILDTTYNKENSSKYTCDLYIKNWSYSYKVLIVFAVYQRMRSKGGSWVGPRLMCEFDIPN